MTSWLTDAQRRAIDKLGYTEDWVRAGMLDDTIARAQLKEFEQPDADKCAEHYRCYALNQFLDGKKALSSVEFDLLLYIAVSELNNSELGEHIHHVICKFDGLKGNQFDELIISYSSKSFDRLKYRRKLQRRIAARKNIIITDVNAAIASEDAQLQSWLVNHECLERHQAETLSEQGVSKYVRHQARAFLRRTAAPKL